MLLAVSNRNKEEICHHTDYEISVINVNKIIHLNLTKKTLYFSVFYLNIILNNYI